MDNKEYRSFLALFRERKLLTATLSLLTWDEQVNLPEGAAEDRAEQIAALAKIIHEKQTDPAYVETLQKLLSSNLDADAVINVREAWRDVERLLRVPGTLVAALSLAESETYSAWVEARKRSSFSFVEKRLEKLLHLKREYASCLARDQTPYDALLAIYEPGTDALQVKEIFASLVPGLQNILFSSSSISPSISVPLPFSGEFSREGQYQCSKEIAEALGFDFRRGRLDEAVHPFCSELGFDDIRMTTRYSRTDFCRALYGTLHEAGHALYELGYEHRNRYSALAEYCSMAVHESQSRFWENMVGRSREFISYLLPVLQRYFPDNFANTDIESLYRFINRIGPSLIRVEADEVSYGLHIVLRFELEQELVSGNLSVQELPEAWDKAYERFLGLVPQNPLEGVLQDVHWYTGNFGYFPTYLLGSAYAAQLFFAAKQDLPSLPGMVSEGNFLPLRQWLTEHIHRHGKRYSARDLIRRATGSEPSGKGYEEYLSAKYLPER